MKGASFTAFTHQNAKRIATFGSGGRDRGPARRWTQTLTKIRFK